MKRKIILVLLVFCISIAISEFGYHSNASQKVYVEFGQNISSLSNVSEMKRHSNSSHFDLVIEFNLEPRVEIFEEEIEELEKEGYSISESLGIIRERNALYNKLEVTKMYEELSLEKSLEFEILKYGPVVRVQYNKSKYEDLINVANDLGSFDFVNRVVIKEIYLFETLSLNSAMDSIRMNSVQTNLSNLDGSGVEIGFLEPTVVDYSTWGYLFASKNDPTQDENEIRLGDELIVDDHALTTALVAAGSTGVAPQATINSVAYTTNNWYNDDLDDLISMGSDVINMSFHFSNTCSSIDTTESRYLNYVVRAQKVTLVAATGNGLDNKDDFSHNTMCAPANATNVISVGSVNDTGDLSPFSNYDTPGSWKGNPLLVAPGEDIFTGTNTSGYDRSFTGTSYSAPFVAGVIALMMQEDSNLKYKPAQVMSMLIASSNDNVISDEYGGTVYSFSDTVWTNINKESVHYPTYRSMYDELVDRCDNGIITCDIETNHYDSVYSITGMSERSGAGRIDAYRVLSKNAEKVYNGYISSSTSSGDVLEYIFYVPQFDKITVGLAWLQNSNQSVNIALNKYNLKLIDPYGNTVVNLTSSLSNLKRTEYYVPYGKSGTYKLVISKSTYYYNPYYSDLISYTIYVD